MNLRRYIGDRAFYHRLFTVLLPILIQNLITNFVSLLDNIMVGQVGTEPMSGVAIVNQLFFVFNLCIFGGLAGAGIFTAQFYGKGDKEGVRNTMRLKLWFGLLVVGLALAILLGLGDRLIGLFLHAGEENLDLEATLHYGREYLAVMLIQTLPFALCQVYTSTLRETGETMLPMKAGITAVFVNLVFNYILIFGKLGVPALGVVGAAVATVLSRFVECFIVVFWAHSHRERCSFIPGLYQSLRVPGDLLKKVAVMSAPLLLNEVLWSGGMTTLNQCYSLRGLEVVSAFNISTTISSLFFVLLCVHCHRQRHRHPGGTDPGLRRYGTGGGRGPEADRLLRGAEHSGGPGYGAAGAAGAAGIQHDRRRQEAGGAAAAGGRLPDAHEFLCQRLLFHPPFRRQDDHYLRV